MPVVACPCGCGAEFIRMVAEREEGVRGDALAARKSARLDASTHRAVFLITGMPGAGSPPSLDNWPSGSTAPHTSTSTWCSTTSRSPAGRSRASPEEATAQSRLATANAAAMARNYADAGATLADYQPQEDVRVMLDPAGHPFCLFQGPL